MNILQLSAVSNWGGGEHHIENLCKELAFSNPEVHNTVLCVENSAFHKRLQSTNIDYVTGPLALKIDPRFAMKIGKICKIKKIDLIHIHDPTALQLIVMADKFYNLPQFIFSKKTSFEIRDRKKTLYKYNYFKIRKFLCVSEETKRISAKAILDKNKLITIYHGTNIHAVNEPAKFQLRDKYNIKKNQIIVGNVANHIEAKDLNTFINVVDRIINDEKQDQFLFVQIGTFSKLTPPLLERVKQLNLTEHILFLDYMPNASSFIGQFDISLMTSQSEGIPQFIYESMLFKVPVVSTAVGGIPEVIENNENGLLARIHDAKQLSDLIIELSRNPKQQQQFTESSYNKLLNNFTTRKMADKTLTVYKDLLNGI